VERLLVLTDYAQVGHLLRTDPALLQTCRVMAVAPMAALEMATQGLPVTLASECLEPGEIAAVDDQAYELSLNWSAHLGDRLIFDDIDLGALTALDHLMFFKQAIGADLLCSRFMESPPDELIFFKPLGRACAEGAAFKDDHDVFEATLLWHAEQAGIRVRLLNWPERQARPEPAPRRTERHPFRVLAGEFERGSLPLVVAFGGDIDLLRYQPSLDTLDDSGRYRTLALSLESYLEAATTRSGLSALDRQYMSIQDFAPEPDIGLLAAWNCRLDKARRLEEKYRRQGAARILANTYLAFHFDFLWDVHFRTALKSLRMFQRFFHRFEPTLVLCDEGSYYLYRLFLWVAKGMGIPTASLPHGNMINYPHYLHFEADRLFCSGRAMLVAAADKANCDPTRVEIIGDLSMVRALARPPIPDGTRRKTVFFVDQRYVNYTLCQMDLEAYLRAWQDIVDYAAARPDVDLLIKPHPSYGYRDKQVAEVAALGLSNLRIVENKKIEDVLAQSDVALMLGRISNAGLTTIELGVPILFYDGISRVPSYGDFLWRPENGVLVVTDRLGLFSNLDRILNESAFAAATAEAQRAVIRNHYPGIAHNVNARFLEAVDRLLGDADAPRSWNKNKVQWG
jgi:hypothetical protein